MTETATVERTAEVLERVEQIASQANCKLYPHPNDKIMMVKCKAGDGRSQTVYVEYSGKDEHGNDFVTFMSPCRVMKGRWPAGGGVSGDLAVDLLRRNAFLNCGSFSLESFEGFNDVLIVKSSQVLATMEADDFRRHITAVADVADEYERECGQDVF